ncbi:MAG: hypothetical protein IPM55_18430 [Acidobacteria bacterium]|nr:hypothetical protein [Acidobacteriota bacterium]
MIYQKYLFRTLVFSSVIVAIAGLSAGLSGCNSGSSVVSDSGSGSTSTPVATAQSTPQPQATASPLETAAKPSPTPNELMRRAAAQPGVPVTVPESMRRPLNSEEMQRALQQMPPEVRARILQGQPGLAKPTPRKQ